MAASQWALVATLTLVSMLAQIDKNVLVLMVGPIQRDFGVGDVQISFLIGAAFAMANIAIGLPAGWLADRFNRRLIIAGGVLVWSLAVASNAFASTFLALVVARIVVGGAEALIPPSAYSLIRDGVDAERRARAMSVYTMGLMLGTGLSLVLGGPMLAWIQSAGIRSIAGFGDVPPWQMALFLIGLVGLPTALLIGLNRDPGRHHADGAAGGSAVKLGLADVWRTLAAQRTVFLPLLVFAAANSIITFGLGSWIPTMTARRFHIGMREIGLMQGGLLLTMGPIGLWLAGLVMDRKRGGTLQNIAGVGVVVSAVVPTLATLLCQSGNLATFWSIDAAVVLFSWTFMAVTSTLVARTVPPTMVGTAMAVVLVINGLIGQGLAPTLIAVVGQRAYGNDPQSLSSAMGAVFTGAGIVAFAAALLLYRAVKGRPSPVPAMTDAAPIASR
ncbi:MFS transporter [Pelomonas sp. KK5]|uniref:MFS transporter n=1 Tax=Pelomonas sp. KK5 TaxID=1855730 RepID=UPI00097C3302|nr:MFS transporter [Pelomonas sp. KK5]